MPIFEEKIPDKPIYYEVRQQARRFLSSSMKGNQIASLIVAVVVFAIMAYSFIISSKYLHVSVPVFFLPGLIGIILPGVVSGLISGEIQKRSMESLLATPLSTGQLVIAKALRAVLPVLATVAAILILVLILLIGKLIYGDDSAGEFYSGWISIPAGIIISLVFSYAVTGICLAVSAVTRSTVASMVTSYGVMMLVYVIVPAIVAPIYMALVGDAWGTGAYMAALHPYGMVALTAVEPLMDQASPGVVLLLILIGLLIQGAIGFFGLAFAASRMEQLKRKGIEG